MFIRTVYLYLLLFIIYRVSALFSKHSACCSVDGGRVFY